MPEPTTPCLVGPTGSGKSDVALHLARRTRGEVISCDAFAVYRGMEILTAAPRAPPDVPHHLVGDRSPDVAWSASAFAEACDQLVEAIRARDRTPWVVGGTALYLRGWLKGFGAPVSRDDAYREELTRLADEHGAPHLHALLGEVDPERADALHPNDQRRVIRALEIVRATGLPASAQRREWDAPDRQPAIVFGLRRPFRDLDDRIRRRTDAMFAAGVVDEAASLRSAALAPEARQALGLEVIFRLLDGEIDEAAARREIATRTRRFAKKQLTFFGSFEGLRWIDVAESDAAETIAERVLDAIPPTDYTSA